MGASAAVLSIALAFVVVALPVVSATSCVYKLIRPSVNNDGYITSPNYPFLYSPGLCIMWIYYGVPGMQIRIRFLDVDIPSYSGCSSDNLRIGPVNEQIYCGSIYSKSFEPYTAEMTSSQYWLHIVFNSTSVETTGRGFRIYYQFSDAFGMFVTPTITTTTVTSTTSTSLYSGEKLEADVNSCHFVFTDKVGEITTNRTVLECLERTNKASWLIYYAGFDNLEAKYEILFEHCSMPYPDTLKVYDGFTNHDSILGSYSESLCPNYLISSRNGLFIEYLRERAGVFPSLKLQFILIGVSHSKSPEVGVSHSKSPEVGVSRNENTDFEVSHSESPQVGVSRSENLETTLDKFVPTENPDYTHSDQCVFQLSDYSGEIRSDYLSSMIDISGFCTWLLHVPTTEGQKVTYELTFDRFQLSLDSVFNVYDGANMSSPVLRSYFSKTYYQPLRSTQSSVFIYYNPGINLPSVGMSEVFTIKYYTVVTCEDDYLPCGYGELGCFRKRDSCNGVWNCPLHGGDERGCSVECPAEFSCGVSTSSCYNEEERCNGKAVCPNNMDEKGCTEEQCSSDKGLYLCRNGVCIYETLRCDGLNSCLDNSDEDDCYATTFPRVIIAAVASSLICALVLVIATGFACKVYRKRVQRLHGGPRHETPLSRQLSDMLRHRAPPPPYHEAMLTSRPYSEAYLELLDESDHQSEALGVLNAGYQDSSDPEMLREQTQRSNWHGTSRSRNNLQHQSVNENQNTSSRLRPESGRLVEVGTLTLFSDETVDGRQYVETTGSDPVGNRDLPSYSETDTLLMAGSFSSESGDEYNHEDTWLGGFFTGDNNSCVSSDRASHIQMEMSSNTAQSPASDQASTFSYLRHSNGVRPVPEEQHGDGESSDKDAVSTSTSLSADSTGMEVVNEEEDKIIENVNVIDEDSDSDCILNENDAEEDDHDDNSSDSDTACILGQM